MADSFVPHDRLPALLAALRAGAEDRELYGARAQRRLLTTALRTSMRSGHLLGRAPAAAASAAPSKPTPGEASTSSGAGSSKAPDAPGASAPAGGYDPSKLPKLDLKKVAGVLVADAPRTMYTVQEFLMLKEGGDNEITRNPWLEARRILWTLLRKTAEGEERALRVEALGPDAARARAPAVAVELVGARELPGTSTPLVEVRYQRGTGAEVGKAVTNVARCTLDAVYLFAALLETGAAAVSQEYVTAREAAWAAKGGGGGGGAAAARASVLVLPRPLDRDVKLPSSCEVCGAEEAKPCGACRTAYYCGKEHQTQDWPAHKADCKRAKQLRAERAAAAAAAESGAGGGSTVVVRLQGPVPGAAAQGQNWMGILPMNQPGKKMAAKAQVTKVDGSMPAPARAADPAKKFLVKIQSPMGVPPGQPLMLYDEGRKVFTTVSPAEQPAGTYAALFRTIQEKGWMGAKCYFWARLESPTELVVQVDPLPGQTHGW